MVDQVTIAPTVPAVWDHFTAAQVRAWTEDAHRRTLDLVNDLTDEQLLGPKMATVNPLLWEVGHVAWFYEKWTVRHPHQRPSILPEADALYDSAAIPHDVRWDLPLLSRTNVLRYTRQVFERALAELDAEPSNEHGFLHLLSLFHEDMHNEAYVINRQAWGYARPNYCDPLASPDADAGPLPGDVDVPGGTFLLGGSPDDPFIHDNEKWAHAVELAPFRMARAPVTQSKFTAFVEDGGYVRNELWSEEGQRWKDSVDATCPVYWEQRDGEWWRRQFEDWVPLEAHRPVMNVCWHEAQAYCKWAGRRLPTEAEWEAAASLTVAGEKRRFPWGDDAPTVERANLDAHRLGAVDVAAHPSGDNAFGCRQMIGNVWEWTASTFLPYPGFVRDLYKEYSEPWFGDHVVLRGGSWLTRSRMIRAAWRNFYLPDRRDVWAGFRTCAPKDE